jgi:arylsulfatase A-like enzyme
MAVDGEALAEAIQRKLVLNKSGRIEKYLYPFLYLDNAGSRPPDSAVLAAARAALEEPEVAAYFTVNGVCSVHNEWERRFRNSFHPLRSGDLMLSYQPEYVEEFGTGRGVSYGSIYDYDIKVPLCFFGPQFRAGVFESPVESVDLVPTLARAIGVPPPSSSVGRVLGEAFVGSEEPIR